MGGVTQGGRDSVNRMLDYLMTDTAAESAVSDTAPLDFAQLAPSPRNNASGGTVTSNV